MKSSAVGYPDRLAGALGASGGVLVIDAASSDPVDVTTRIATGLCWKNTVTDSSGSLERAILDQLILTTVPADEHRQGQVVGQGGFNDFPQAWADQRNCDTYPSHEIPVLVRPT